MSHHALQQLVVRMLFDPEFASAVYADQSKTLANEDLTEAEKSQLLSVDRRAWGYDGLRRRRTLRTLAEEYRISTTIILSETRRLAALDDFFSSEQFHDAVRGRGSLGMGFADFLQAGLGEGKWTAPQIPDVVRLESALAGCRRSLAGDGAAGAADLPSTISDRAVVAFSPGCDIGSFQGNIIETVQKVEQYLFELNLMPAMALCDDAPRLTGLPEVEPRRKVWLMFAPGATGITLSHIDKSTYLVLYEVRRPSEIRSVIMRAVSAGVRETQAQEILASALETGTIRIMESEGV